MVCFHGRSIVPRPYMSEYSWSCQVPKVSLHEQGVPSLIVVPGITSAGVPLRRRSYGLMRQSSTLPLPTVSPLVNGSVPVAVSPGWEEDLPDVISASLSLRAWTPTPAARVVLVPVSSHTTAAFPALGPGRRSAISVQRLQYGAFFEAAVIHSCSGPQVCSPPRSLLPLRTGPYGSRGFSVRASRGSLPHHAPDMLAVRIG